MSDNFKVLAKNLIANQLYFGDKKNNMVIGLTSRPQWLISTKVIAYYVQLIIILSIWPRGVVDRGRNDVRYLKIMIEVQNSNSN